MTFHPSHLSTSSLPFLSAISHFTHSKIYEKRIDSDSKISKLNETMCPPSKNQSFHPSKQISPRDVTRHLMKVSRHHLPLHTQKLQTLLSSLTVILWALWLPFKNHWHQTTAWSILFSPLKIFSGAIAIVQWVRRLHTADLDSIPDIPYTPLSMVRSNQWALLDVAQK